MKEEERMFQRILVPLDGSKQAEQALPVAACLARAATGKVVLAHVVLAPRAFRYSELAETEVEDARAYLRGLSQSEELAGVQTSVAVSVAITRPASVLLSLIETHQIDLVVMSSHGYTGFKRLVLGSVAEKIAHHSPVPVLLLRRGGRCRSGGGWRWKGW
jgi:nucleotide-binding universal stress UspA family protein